MNDELGMLQYPMEVRLVVFRKSSQKKIGSWCYDD
jgi:hypothetical protein